MTYRVIYTDGFLADIADHIAYLRGEHVGQDTLETWYERLFERLDTLDQMPLIHPVSESFSAEHGYEVRKMNYGEYLVFYRVHEAKRTVELMAFTHGARRRA